MDGDPLPTTEEFAGWLLLGDALAKVKQVQGQVAYESIVTRLASGLIRSASEHYQFDNDQPKGCGGIKQAVWQAIEKSGHIHAKPFWATNDVEVSIRAGYDRANVHKFFTVRVDPAGIAKMLPAKPEPAPATTAVQAYAVQARPASPQAKPHLGGRPPAAYWDKLWAHICVLLYTGKLIPAKQADLEKAMLDWASVNGHDLSEQSARTRARLLKEALGRKDKN